MSFAVDVAGLVPNLVKQKAYYAVLAGVVVIGGGAVGGSYGRVISSRPGAPWSVATRANLEISTNGSYRCSRTSLTNLPLASNHICKTFDQANAAAANGDVVAVMGGDYPSDGLSRIDSNPSNMGGDALLLINDNTRTRNATFACGDTSPVTTQGRYLLFLTQHLKITGKCFSFHKVIMGDYRTGYFPSNKVCTDETITGGASMQVFDILGPCNKITISNSNIGPSVACHSGGILGCKPEGTGRFGTLTYTGEQYYADRGIGNDDCCTEPKIHSGGFNGSITPHTITITGNQFYGFSTRDPDNGPHAGCLWLGWNDSSGSANVTVRNNTFGECMTYDIHIDSPPSRGITIAGNTFSRPKDAIRTATDFTHVTDLPHGTGPEPGYWVDIEAKCVNNSAWPGYTITGNTFSPNGYDLDYGGCTGQTYPALVIDGNTLPRGAPNNPTQPQR